jgi:hypothetical protein
MVGIAQNNLRLEFMQLAWADGFHASLRPDGHERRRLNHAMGGRQAAAPRLRRSIFAKQLKHVARQLADGAG